MSNFFQYDLFISVLDFKMMLLLLLVTSDTLITYTGYQQYKSGVCVSTNNMSPIPRSLTATPHCVPKQILYSKTKQVSDKQILNQLMSQGVPNVIQ